MMRVWQSFLWHLSEIQKLIGRGIRMYLQLCNVLVRLVAERKSATKALAGIRIQSQMDKQSSERERESSRVEEKERGGRDGGR